MINTDDFWERVKYLIRIKAITQERTAKACGISFSTFRGWISKKYFPPIEDTYNLARFLGVSIDFLISGREPDRKIQIKEKYLISFRGHKAHG